MRLIGRQIQTTQEDVLNLKGVDINAQKINFVEILLIMGWM
jgi:hypothetical protein